MTEKEFITVISTLAKEIDMLKFENEQLEKANIKLAEKLGKIGLEAIRKEYASDEL